MDSILADMEVDEPEDSDVEMADKEKPKKAKKEKEAKDKEGKKDKKDKKNKEEKKKRKRDSEVGSSKKKSKAWSIWFGMGKECVHFMALFWIFGADRFAWFLFDLCLSDIDSDVVWLILFLDLVVAVKIQPSIPAVDE